MAVSFLVYPAYLVIILLPLFSLKVKAAVILVASLVSWALFSIGMLLAGKKGYDRLKGLLKALARSLRRHSSFTSFS